MVTRYKFWIGPLFIYVLLIYLSFSVIFHLFVATASRLLAEVMLVIQNQALLDTTFPAGVFLVFVFFLFDAVTAVTAALACKFLII